MSSISQPAPVSDAPRRLLKPNSDFDGPHEGPLLGIFSVPSLEGWESQATRCLQLCAIFPRSSWSSDLHCGSQMSRTEVSDAGMLQMVVIFITS